MFGGGTSPVPRGGGENGSGSTAAMPGADGDDEGEGGRMMDIVEDEEGVQVVGASSSSPPLLPPPPPPVLVNPQSPGAPVISEAVRRSYDVEWQGNVYSMLCLVSVASGNVYNINRKIRDAIYGSVRQGYVVQQREGSYHLMVDQRVALKVIKRERLSRPQSEDPLKEIAVMQRLRQAGIHPNVMHLVEVVQDQENIYIILPFCGGGELCQWFENQRRILSEDVARKIFLQVMDGLQYLHDHGVVHRDISLENLLVDQTGEHCIIIDMGMCVLLDQPARPHVWVHRQRACGKSGYMAPEIYSEQDFIAPAIDIWAVGVILFIMLTGVPPLEKPWPLDRRYNFIAEGRLRELMQIWGISGLSPEAVDLLVGLLQVNPRLRLTSEQILAHPWVAPYLAGGGEGPPDAGGGGGPTPEGGGAAETSRGSSGSRRPSRGGSGASVGSSGGGGGQATTGRRKR